MMQYNQDWDVLGRNIQDIVDRAVNARDYRHLNQTIRQVVGTAVDLGGEAVRRARENAARAAAQAAAPQKNLPVLYANPGSLHSRQVLKIVGGSLLTGFTLMGLLGVAVLKWLLWLPVTLGPTSVLFGLAGVGLGGGLIFGGARKLGYINRFRTYRRTLGEKTQCALEKLARSVGKSVSFVRKELWKMIDEGLFLEGHMDREQTHLITSHETYRLFEQSRLQLEQRQAALEQEKKAASTRDPQVQEVLDRGSAFVAQIRKCNDDIPGEEISAKIDRMEDIVRRIFRRVETNPEVIPDLKKLMDYYLPMTVKLLNAYADMDAQPIQGENIQASKREIEGTLDTLNLAFEKLLDDLFADTALDVSSDISVLQTMLAREGLTEDELTKMRKNNG